MPPRSRRLLTVPRAVQILMVEIGIDLDALARKAGVPSISSKLTPPQMDTLIDSAFEAVGDESMGLSAGADVRPELFGVVGLSAMAAPTLGVALARIDRYKQIFSVDTIELVSGRGASRVRVLLNAPRGPHARARADMELAFILSFSRRMTRTRVTPLRVDLRGPAPAHRARLEAFFGSPVHYEQRDDAILLSSLDLARPLSSSSTELSGLLGPRAEQLLIESGSEDAVAQVRAVLRRMLNGDEPTMGAVARALGTSPRSLQRRLAEARTSFAALLNEVRHELACERLVHSDIDLAEISFLLGFADARSFHRAFKRWEGVTPLEYRRGASSSSPDVRRA
jgi:AraC-like DNA-binding protein